MGNEDSIVDIEYSEERTPEVPPPVHAPPPPAAPSRPRTGLIIGIIGAIVACIVVLIVIMAVFNPFGPPFIGKWHITYEEVYYGNYNLGGKVDYYITFYANGTGEITGSNAGSQQFLWHDLGNNQVSIYNKGDSTNITFTYKISGENIELTYHVDGKTVKLKGNKV